MPVIKSAQKKMRQAVVKSARNKKVRDLVKEKIAAFRKKPEKKILAGLFSALDKAAKVGIFHRNKSARLKSRLSKLLDK